MKKKAVLAAMTLLILLMNIAVIPVHAASGNEGLRDGKPVRVACGMNDALYLDESGEPAGLALPYIRQIAWNAGWALEYVEGSYSDSLQRLYDGEIDLMFPVGGDEDPDGKLLFSEFSGGIQQIGLYARDDADLYYEDYVTFNGKTVGLTVGANSRILDDYADEHGFSYNMETSYNTVQDKVKALQDGKVDMVAFSTLNSVPGGKLVAVLEQLPVYFCTSKQNTELYRELNEAISQAMIKTPDVVSQCARDLMTGTATVSYTRAEHEIIEGADTVTFGVYHDCLPLAGVNSNGECCGIYVDTIKAIAKQSGLNIKIVPVEDDSRLYSYMDDGTVDFVMSVFELRFFAENADNYLISNGISDYTTLAVSMPDYEFEEGKSTSFALTKMRSYLKDYIDTNFPGATVQYFKTRRECMEAVKSGQADATFLNSWEYNYESRNPRFSDLMEWENIRADSTFAIGATKDSDLEILSILEKTISQFPKSTLTQIVTDNLNIPYNSYTFFDRVYMMKEQIIVVSVFAIVLIIFLYVRKKHTKELEEKNSLLEKSNNAKDVFLSRMSHELRTPLNAINGYAAVIQQNAVSHKYDEGQMAACAESILRAGKYQLAIISDLLDIQKIESGKLELVPIEVDSTEYMKNIVAMIEPEAREKNIDFSYERLSSVNETYEIDGVRFQQVLLNLLHNAVKFTSEGGRVRMTAEAIDSNETHNVLKFTISDTGIGMSEDFQKNYLFHRFAQEYKGNTSPYEGCGTGLALSRDIMHLMGGEITCESKQGVGSTFTVVLTAKHIKKRRRDTAKIDYSAYDLTGVRVLICEDNKMNQDIERRLLEKMNCKVDIANDGQIGVDMFSKSDEGYYNVILMDIRMPNMDGLEAAEAIRALPRKDAKSVTIIAVSANSFPEDVRKSLASGMNEHLAKPVDVTLLYDNISAYCLPGHDRK